LVQLSHALQLMHITVTGVVNEKHVVTDSHG